MFVGLLLIGLFFIIFFLTYLLLGERIVQLSLLQWCCLGYTFVAVITEPIVLFRIHIWWEGVARTIG